jgi:hypothetical protein
MLVIFLSGKLEEIVIEAKIRLKSAWFCLCGKSVMCNMITYSDAVIAKNNSPAVIANNELKFGEVYCGGE